MCEYGFLGDSSDSCLPCLMEGVKKLFLLISALHVKQPGPLRAGYLVLRGTNYWQREARTGRGKEQPVSSGKFSSLTGNPRFNWSKKSLTRGRHVASHATGWPRKDPNVAGIGSFHSREIYQCPAVGTRNRIKMTGVDMCVVVCLDVNKLDAWSGCRNKG